jgi:hypothetical protein
MRFLKVSLVRRHEAKFGISLPRQLHLPPAHIELLMLDDHVMGRDSEIDSEIDSDEKMLPLPANVIMSRNMLELVSDGRSTETSAVATMKICNDILGPHLPDEDDYILPETMYLHTYLFVLWLYCGCTVVLLWLYCGCTCVEFSIHTHTHTNTQTYIWLRLSRGTRNFAPLRTSGTLAAAPVVKGLQALGKGRAISA